MAAVSQERYELALEASNDGIWEWNVRDGSFYLSDRAFEIMGGSDRSKAFSFEDCVAMIVPGQREEFQKVLESALQSRADSFQTEVMIENLGKGKTWLQINARIRRDPHYEPISVVGSITDITSQKSYQSLLKFAADHDNLTGLPNRVFVVKQIHEAISRLAKRKSEKFAVLFFDLDRFKIINDSLGHIQGDKMLRSIASRLQDMKADNSLVGRLGGDEFIFVLWRFKNKQEIIYWAEKILSELENTHMIDGYQINVSTSIGIVVVKEPDIAAEEILQQADIAMYEAKHSGGSRYVFYDKKLHAQVMNRLHLEQEIARQIREEGFTMHFQPIICARTGKLKSCEALLRLGSENRAWNSIFEVIQLAEETGLILEIGEWVIKESLAFLAKIQAAGISTAAVSINVSTVQFQQADFVDNLLAAVDKSQVDPHYIEIEITENILLEDNDFVRKSLNRLRKRGIKVSIDDFGTGYSSIGYLTKFPISTVKIDKSYIDPIPRSRKQKHIVEGITQLAHNLRIEVTAEGVESKDQYDYLKKVGVDKIQGWYFDKAMKPQELIRKYAPAKKAQKLG